MATIPQGRFYWFLRLPGPVKQGHMGWGFKFNDDSYLMGSIENQGGNPVVGQKNDNDYWYAWAGSENHMLSVMREPTDVVGPMIDRPNVDGYTYYKIQPKPHAFPNFAEDEAAKARWFGYSVAVGNCLDNAIMIANAYGVSNEDYLRHWGPVSPRMYFNRFLSSLTKYEL